jgi:hypothetical protein
LSDDEQKKIYDSVFDLTKVFPLKSVDELKQMLDEHYFCKTESSHEEVHVERAATPAPKETTRQVETVSASFDDTDSFDDIDDLLKDL